MRCQVQWRCRTRSWHKSHWRINCRIKELLENSLHCPQHLLLRCRNSCRYPVREPLPIFKLVTPKTQLRPSNQSQLFRCLYQQASVSISRPPRCLSHCRRIWCPRSPPLHDFSWGKVFSFLNTATLTSPSQPWVQDLCKPWQSLSLNTRTTWLKKKPSPCASKPSARVSTTIWGQGHTSTTVSSRKEKRRCSEMPLRTKTSTK